MPKPIVQLGVRNTGLYRPLGSLPDINQPDTLSVEKYIGAPFYAYMFLSTQKQEDLRKESVVELLSKPEAVNYYVERMSRDLKLQKAAMAATLLKTTYVKMKELRKFIWQHKNAEKVIARDDLGQLPAFKKMLTRFVLLNYCAMNTPGVSGAEWVPEKHPKSAFDAANDAYKKEFAYFEWQGENCRLRHPNPLGGHPKVNFSAYTDDTSNGRVFVMDLAKHDLVNEINTVNAQIFELLSQYLGSLSVPPSAGEIASEGVHYEVETPAVFESISAKETRPDVYFDEDGRSMPSEAVIGQAYQKRQRDEQAAEAARLEEVARLTRESAEAAKAAADPKLKGDAKKAAKAAAENAKKAADAALGEEGLSSSSSSMPKPPRVPKAKKPTLDEAAKELGLGVKDSPEFLEQEEGLKGGLAMASAKTYLGTLERSDVDAALAAVFEGSDISVDSIGERTRELGAALYTTGYFNSKKEAKLVAADIIGRALTAYRRSGKALKAKKAGFVAFTKKGELSKIGASSKTAQATKLVRKMLARGKFNPDAALDAI